MTIDRMTVTVRGETYELVADDCGCEMCAFSRCCDRFGAPRFNSRAPCVALGVRFRKDARRGRREAEPARREGRSGGAAKAGQLKNKLSKKGKKR